MSKEPKIDTTFYYNLVVIFLVLLQKNYQAVMIAVQ